MISTIGSMKYLFPVSDVTGAGNRVICYIVYSSVSVTKPIIFEWKFLI